MKRKCIPITVLCLTYFVSTNSSYEQDAFDGLKKITIYSFISFLSLQSNKLLQQSEIKQKLSSVQKMNCITGIANKKVISVFYVSGVLCSWLQSAIQTKYFLQFDSIFLWKLQRRRKTTNWQLYVILAVLQRFHPPFLLSRTFETFFRKLSILLKI